MVSFGPEIAAKRLELVKQVFEPSTSRVGALLSDGGFALNRAYLQALSRSRNRWRWSCDRSKPIALRFHP